MSTPGPPSRTSPLDIFAQIADDHRIVAEAAVGDIDIVARHQEVVTITTVQGVGPLSAPQLVVPRLAMQHVALLGAEKDVVAVPPEECDEARWAIVESFDEGHGRVFRPVATPKAESIHVKLSDDPDLCCRENQIVEVLTSGNDNEYALGGGGDTCVVSLGGNDWAVTSTFDDTLLGHAGNDTLQASGGDDIVLGGPGDDYIEGSSGNDVMHGAGDDDVIYCGSGADEAWGGTGNDTMYGSSGDDLLIPGLGLDAVYGGGDDDQVVIRALCEVENGEILDGGSGPDTLWLPEGVTVQDLTNLGATVTGFSTANIEDGEWGTVECP